MAESEEILVSVEVSLDDETLAVTAHEDLPAITTAIDSPSQSDDDDNNNDNEKRMAGTSDESINPQNQEATTPANNANLQGEQNKHDDNIDYNDFIDEDESVKERIIVTTTAQTTEENRFTENQKQLQEQNKSSLPISLPTSSSSSSSSPPPTNNTDNDYGSSSCTTAWSNCIQNTIHKPVVRVLLFLSRNSAINPKTTLVAIIWFSIFVFVLGLFTNFNLNVDDEVLWSPVGSRPLQHSNWIREESSFPKSPRRLYMYVHNHGGNVLADAPSGVAYVAKTIEVVRTTPGYDSICFNRTEDFLPSTLCKTFSILDFFVNHHNISDYTQQEVLEIISQPSLPDGSPFDINGLLGKSVFDSQQGIYTYAQTFRISIALSPLDETFDVEEKIIDRLLKLRKEPNDFTVELFAERSFDDEFTRTIVKDIPLVVIVYTVMSIFTCFVFFKRNRVQSRILVGVGALSCVFFSVMTGYGLMFLCGVPFTPMTQLLPFLMFGIGLDDAFILSGSFHRTDIRKPLVNRIEETMRDVGASIALTTATSAMAFGLGGLSSIPTVSWLCWYACPTLLVDFLYQVTYFIAILVIDERRVLDGRNDVCFWIVSNNDDNNEAIDGGDETDNNRHNLKHEQSHSSGLKTQQEQQVLDEKNNELLSPVGIKDNQGTKNNDGNDYQTSQQGEAITDRIMSWYARQLLRPWVKIIVLASFTVLFGFCVHSASQLTQEFEFTDVVPGDSYLQDFWYVYNTYLERPDLPLYAYCRDVDHSDPQVRNEIKNFINDLTELRQFGGVRPPYFWLEHFEAFVNDNPAFNNNTSSLSSFNEQISAFLSVPVYANLYKDDFGFDHNGNLTQSRIYMSMSYIDQSDVLENIDALHAQQNVARAQPINQGKNDWAFFTYATEYNFWAFYAVAVEELTRTTFWGVVSVSAIAFLAIPHWSALLFVAPLISILYADLLGVLQYGGIHINAISYISLVMSIGLMVDFLMHILLRYYEIPGSRSHKVQETLRTMGSSVLIGGTSTFLAVIPLAFSASDIFYTVFITFLGLVTLGLGHGLILLPVLLSIFGPTDTISNTLLSSSSNSEVSEKV